MTSAASQSTQKSLQAAQKARKENRIKDAISLYQQVLKTNASSVAAQKALGDIYFNQKQYDLSKKYYVDAMKLASEDSFICFRLGRIADISGNWEEAITYYEHSAYLNPKDFKPYQCLGEGYFFRKQMEKAEAKYKRAIEAGSPMPWVRFKLGQIAREKDDYPTTIDYFQQAITLNPKNPNFRLALGDVYLSQKELNEAVESYKSVLDTKPNLFPAHFKLGRAYQMRQQWDDAIAAFNSAIQLKPQDARSYQFLGEVHFTKENFDLARNSYLKAVELGSSVPWVRFKLGRIAYAQKDYERAIAYFEEAITLNPKNPQFHYYLGASQVQNSSVDKAAESYKRALSFNPNHAPSKKALDALFEDGLNAGEALPAEALGVEKAERKKPEEVLSSHQESLQSAQASAAVEAEENLKYKIVPSEPPAEAPEPHPNGFVEKIWQRLFG